MKETRSPRPGKTGSSCAPAPASGLGSSAGRKLLAAQAQRIHTPTPVPTPKIGTRRHMGTHASLTATAAAASAATGFRLRCSVPPSEHGILAHCFIRGNLVEPFYADELAGPAEQLPHRGPSFFFSASQSAAASSAASGRMRRKLFAVERERARCPGSRRPQGYGPERREAPGVPREIKAGLQGPGQLRVVGLQSPMASADVRLAVAEQIKAPVASLCGAPPSLYRCGGQRWKVVPTPSPSEPTTIRVGDLLGEGNSPNLSVAMTRDTAEGVSSEIPRR
jgi:hypothetical protein